jgi:hypothetical protein
MASSLLSGFVSSLHSHELLQLFDGVSLEAAIIIDHQVEDAAFRVATLSNSRFRPPRLLAMAASFISSTVNPSQRRVRLSCFCFRSRSCPHTKTGAHTRRPHVHVCPLHDRLITRLPLLNPCLNAAANGGPNAISAITPKSVGLRSAFQQALSDFTLDPAFTDHHLAVTT